MSIEEIRSFRNAKPFRPFAIVLRNGRTIQVPGPERISIAPWGKVGVSENSLPLFFAADDVADLKVTANESI
jgi:hypothetical protein